MYLDHFGLREAPFGLTPDTSFFFASRRYQEALNTLQVACSSGEGFIKVTGEVGTGKTLLCRKFMSSLGDDYVTAYIPNPYMEPQALLLSLADELGVHPEMPISQHQLIKALTLALLDYAAAGKQVVVCLDEVQAMPQESLEALRLLSNLETEKRKLLQVVLFGQPELDQRLDLESVRQLKQRITFQYHLSFLERDELEYYVNHRLSVAGYSRGPLFSRVALKRLFEATGGVPRLVNIIAHKALMAAFGSGLQRVEVRQVELAVADTPAARPRIKHPARWIPLVLGIGSGALVSLAWILLR